MKNEGHGGHWECVTDLDYLADEGLVYLLEEGKAEDVAQVNAIFFDNTKASTEIIYSFTLDNNLSAMALNVVEQNKEELHFISGYPFIKDGERLSLKLTDIQEWEDKFEAVLTTETEYGCEVSFFDAKYFKNKEKYKIGNTYEFVVSAFAYYVEPLVERTFSFEGEKAVDWLEKIGKETTLDNDDEVEPITFDMSGLVAYLPNDEYPDDAEFQSPIESITTDEIFEEKFYQFKITLFRDPDISINLFAKKSFFDEPLAQGDPIRGKIWMQGFLADEI